MDAFNDDDAELNSFLRTLSPVHIQQSTTSPSLDQRSPSLGVSTSTFQPNQQHSQSQSQQSASPFGFLDPDSYQLAQGQLQNQDWWASSSAMGSADRPVVGRDGGAGEAGGARSVPRPGYTMQEYASLIAERIQNISQNSNSNDSHNHTFRSSLSASGDYREAGSGYATPSYASSYGSYQDDLGAFDGASSNGDLTADSGYNLNGDDHDSKGDVANADFFSSFDNFNCQSLAQDPAELDVPLPSDSDSHQPGWPFNRSLTGQSSASHLAVNLHLSAPKRTSTMETDATICPEPPAPRIRMPPAHQSSLPSSHLSSFDFASDTLSAASPENLSEEPVAWPESPKGMSEKSFFEGDILSAHSGSSYDQPIPSPRLVSSKVSSTAAPLQSQSHTSDSKASPQNSANYDSQPKPSVPSASGSSSSSPSRFNIQQLSLSNSAPPPISITPSQSPSSTSSPSNSNQWSSPILQNSSGNLNLSPTEPDEQLFRNAGSLPPTNPRLISLGQMPQAGGSQGLSDQLQINIVPSTPTMGLAGTKTQSSNEFAYAISRAVRSPVHGSSSTGSSPRARSSPTTQNVPSQSRLVSSSPVQQPQTFGSSNGHPSTSPTSPAPETPSFFPQTVTLASNGSEEMSWLSSLGNAATEPNIQSQITVSPPQAGPSSLEFSPGNPRPTSIPYPFFSFNSSFPQRQDLATQPDRTGSNLPVTNQVSPFLKAPPQRQRSRSEASLVPYDFGPVPVPPTMNPNHLAKPGSNQPSLNLSASLMQQQQRHRISSQQQQQEHQLLLLQQQIQHQLQQQRQLQQQQQQQQQQFSQQFQFQIQPPQSDAQNASTFSTSFAGNPFLPLNALQKLQMQQQMQPVDFYQSQSQLSTLSPSLNPSSSVHHQSLDGKPRRTSFGGGTFGAGTPNYGQGLLNPWAGMSGLPAGEHAALGMPGPGVQRSLSDAGSNRISHRKVKSVDLSSSPYLGVPNNPSRSPRHRSPSRPTSTASSSSTVPVSNSSSDVKSLPMSSYAGLNSHSGLSPTQDLVQMDMNMFDSDEDDGDTDPDGPSIMLTPLSEVSASGGAGGSEELNVRKQSVTTNKTANASKSRRKVVAHFICPIPGCGTTFTRSFNLKGHLRSHTDERPFKCETCGKGFARQHDCKRHMALHVGYRPHSCVGCKKKFARLDALSRHLKSDAGQECLRVAETSALASDTDPEADIEETLEKADSLGGSESSSPPAERDRRMPTRGMSGVLL